MSLNARHELIQSIAQRYHEVSKTDKERILSWSLPPAIIANPLPACSTTHLRNPHLYPHADAHVATTTTSRLPWSSSGKLLTGSAPNAWCRSCPNSLRRSNDMDIYISKSPCGSAYARSAQPPLIDCSTRYGMALLLAASRPHDQDHCSSIKSRYAPSQTGTTSNLDSSKPISWPTVARSMLAAISTL